MKNKNTKATNHSFYKEAKKSILAQQEWNPKRIGKFFLTLFKWFIYGFLIIATLWGCVNEFIIQTSNNLGQGVEFYQNDDFVYPNMYQAVQITTYENSTDELTNGIKEKNVSTHEILDDEGNGIGKYELDNQTEPFDFYVVNPHFGADIETEGYDPEWNVSDFYIKSSELENPSSYTYNLNLIPSASLGSVTTTGMFDYESNSILSTVNSNSWTVPISSLPIAIRDIANEKIESAKLSDDYSYTVSSMLSFEFFLIDQNDGINGVADSSLRENDFFNWREETEEQPLEYKYSDLYSSNGTIVFTPSSSTDLNSTLNLESWTIVNSLSSSYDDEAENSEKINDLVSQAKREINKYAFNNGTLRATYDDLPNDIKEGFSTIALELGLTEIPTEVQNYQADFSEILPDDHELGRNSFGGSQTVVIPISKGFPIDMTEESKNLISSNDDSSFRNSDYTDWDISLSENQDQGFDPETQMYGWTLLDASNTNSAGKSDVLRSYSSVEEIQAVINGEKSVTDDMTEEDAFYADQRRLGWGVASTNDTVDIDGNVTTSSGIYSVFDEKIKSKMRNPNENLMISSSSAIVGDEIIEYDYATTFAGISTIDEVQNYSSDYVGSLPKYEIHSSNDDDVIWERSILSDSVISTGQDSWGESRISFNGWSDWGKAWNVQYGPLYGAFVFPLAQISMEIGEWFNYFSSPWGTLISIFVIVFLTRGLGALISLRGTSNQLKMQEIQTEVAKIKSKYNKYDLKKEPRFKQKQQAEIMTLYRKNNVNPMGSLGTIFLTMPIFISLWIIISSLPAYKVVAMGNFSWAVSSWYGIFNLGGVFILYLLVGISVGMVQGVSSKLPTWLGNKRKGIKRVDDATKEAQKKQNRTQNIMIGVFVFMGLTVPALFAFYWICSGFFTMLLELMRHTWRNHVSRQIKLDSKYQTPMKKLKIKVSSLFTKA